MDRRLLDLLVCPLCKGPLEYRRSPEELVCPADRLAFPVRDGIPAMLESEGPRPLATPAERRRRPPGRADASGGGAASTTRPAAA